MEPQKREERSERLDPDLVNHSFTIGWAFSLPASFKAAFDIRWDVRQENRVRRQTWTQGTNFSFSCGDIIYDTPKAYEVWSDALQHFTTCLQVIEAIPSRPGSGGQVRFRASHPNDQRTALVSGKIYTCSQPQFVELLRNGTFEGKPHIEL
jgi:hypothetical protein